MMIDSFLKKIGLALGLTILMVTPAHSATETQSATEEEKEWAAFYCKRAERRFDLVMTQMEADIRKGYANEPETLAKLLKKGDLIRKKQAQNMSDCPSKYLKKDAAYIKNVDCFAMASSVPEAAACIKSLEKDPT